MGGRNVESGAGRGEGGSPGKVAWDVFGVSGTRACDDGLKGRCRQGQRVGATQAEQTTRPHRFRPTREPSPSRAAPPPPESPRPQARPHWHASHAPRAATGPPNAHTSCLSPPSVPPHALYHAHAGLKPFPQPWCASRRPPPRFHTHPAPAAPDGPPCRLGGTSQTTCPARCSQSTPAGSG